MFREGINTSVAANLDPCNEARPSGMTEKFEMISELF